MTKPEYLQATVVWSIFGFIALSASLYFFINAKTVNIEEDIEYVTGIISNSPKLKNAGGKTLSQALEIELKNDSRIFRLEGIILDAVDTEVRLLNKGQRITIACFKDGHKNIVEGTNHSTTTIWGLSVNNKKLANEQELINVKADRGAGIGFLFGVAVCIFIAFGSYKSYKRAPNTS
jgi:hypothetical protein